MTNQETQSQGETKTLSDSVQKSTIWCLGLVIILIGLLAALPYLFTTALGYDCPILDKIGGVGLAALAIGMALFLKEKEPATLPRFIFWSCFGVFVAATVLFGGFALYQWSQNHESSLSARNQTISLFCGIQAVIYAVALYKYRAAKKNNVECGFHKLFLYPLVIALAVAIAQLPGYEGLYCAIGKTFLGFLVFTQLKDLWELREYESSGTDASASADVKTVPLDHTTLKDLDASDAKVDKVTIGDLVTEGVTAKSVNAKQVLAEQESAVAEAEPDMTDDATGAGAANPNGEPLPEDKNGSPTKER